MSISAGDPTLFTLSTGLEERRVESQKNLRVRTTTADAGALLPRVLAVQYGVFKAVRLVGGGSEAPLLVLLRSPAEGSRSGITVDGSVWRLLLSKEELGALARFLVEILLGVLAADHIDFDDRTTSDVVTFLTDSPFDMVDEQEARRRLARGGR